MKIENWENENFIRKNLLKTEQVRAFNWAIEEFLTEQQNCVGFSQNKKWEKIPRKLSNGEISKVSNCERNF